MAVNTAAKLVSAYFTAKEFKHAIKGDNGDIIEVGVSGLENVDTIKVYLLFDEDGKRVTFRAGDYCKFPESKINDMYRICSQMNKEYRWEKFYVDESDNTICIQDDAVIEPSTAGEECFELFIRMVKISDGAYPNFMKAIWQ